MELKLELRLSVPLRRPIKRLFSRFRLPGINRHKKSIQPKRSIDYLLALPDELKLQILRLALPSGKKIGSPWACLTYRSNMHVDSVCYKDCWLNLVRALPEMAGLIYEVFYGQNIIWMPEFCTTLDRSYPPRPINMFVRHLEIELVLAVKNLDYLRRLGNGDLGFPDLRSISITINGHGSPMLGGTAKGNDMLDILDDEDDFTPAVKEMRQHLEAIEPIIFHTCKLEITYKHAWFIVKLPGVPHFQISDPMEDLLLQKITIAEAAGNNVISYRYHGSTLSTEPDREYVAAWPARDMFFRPGARYKFNLKRTSVKLITK
ncbi:hypothetical protein J4E85_002998 [Alternaria conjuncta]|uniref:uncharacterized protein n=1 Tax=Alternaria conjuncta TaxID=181017 RepID=UPI00221E3F10|nr:uncharacterized protein J4E85_002998 [Alternaria conjuncta]KAI4932600.1 hypothetical protein J4E85_002998 [Alternaria conjuncta]